MPDEDSNSTTRTQGKVRWRRFAIVAVPAAAIASILIGLTAQGAIASSISVSGQEFLVTASQLNGTGFEQFGGQAPGNNKPVIVSVIKSASLSNLCQLVTAGPITLRLTAGGGGNPVKATNLVVDASGQTGSDAFFHNIIIGQDAGQLGGPPGGFGQQATSIRIKDLVQHTWLTTAGTFDLPGLSIGFGGSC